LQFLCCRHSRAGKEASMKKRIVIAGVGVVALALPVLASASSQSIQQTPVPGRTTPMAGGMAGHAPTGTGPAAKADCSNNGWQNYPSENFKDQKSCESYVHKQASTKKGAGAHSKSRTPRPGASSPGPGQSSTLAPTPQPPR
jgi:hypothetical protein